MEPYFLHDIIRNFARRQQILAKVVFPDKEIGLGSTLSLSVSNHCRTRDFFFGTHICLCYQVTEVQSRTSLPHSHGLFWCHDLPRDVRQTLHLLQQDNASMRLAPGQVEPLVEVGAAAITVSLQADRLAQQFPLLSAEQASRFCCVFCQNSSSDLCIRRSHL